MGISNPAKRHETHHRDEGPSNFPQNMPVMLVKCSYTVCTPLLMTFPESPFEGIGELRIPMEAAGDGCESVSIFSISVNEIVGGTIVKVPVALVFAGCS